jgi:hypothetical protein
MPLHDWTRVSAGTFHDFHVSWNVALKEALNTRLLPAEYYAQLAPAPPGRPKAIAVRRLPNHHLAAQVHLVSTANKNRAASVVDFVTKAQQALQGGCNLLIVDVLPPGMFDAQGMHGALWQHLAQESCEPPINKPLMVAAYVSKPTPEAYLEHVAVGENLPEMSLFLTPEAYISIPLEQSYMAAFKSIPAIWRRTLEGRGGHDA